MREPSRLTDIAYASKRYWGYPDDWISIWGRDLTIAPEFISSHMVYVATDDSTIVGFYGLERQDDRCSVEHLWVLPEWIRKGVGRRLFEHAVEVATSSGARFLEIESDPHAEGFYASMGARKIGEVQADIEGVKRVLPKLMLELPAI